MKLTPRLIEHGKRTVVQLVAKEISKRYGIDFDGEITIIHGTNTYKLIQDENTSYFCESPQFLTHLIELERGLRKDRV